jgi:hypothetical protein
MSQVQASIHLLSDFHDHDGGTARLAALPPAQRQQFLQACADELHGGRIADFLALQQSSAFRPILTHQTGTHPSMLAMNEALVAAVVAYNEEAFPLRFDTNFAAAPKSADVAIPPYTCVQWVWVNGQLVVKYNYNLLVVHGSPPTASGLRGAYRVMLAYS